MSPEMPAYVPVWFTRPLSGDEVQLAREKGIEPVVHPLIRIEFEPAGSIIERTANLPKPDALLFTSRNAVNAFLACRVMKAGWLNHVNVFAVGERTAAVLREAGIDCRYPGHRQDGSSAAEMMAEKLKPGSVVWHFASDKKRPEAASVLKTAGIRYHSITAYTTHLLKEAGIPQEPFAAVVFYSPSAVEAFESYKSGIPDETFIAATGSTTAEALHRLGIDGVVTAQQPSTEALIHLLSRHFTS